MKNNDGFEEKIKYDLKHGLPQHCQSDYSFRIRNQLTCIR